MEGTSFGNIEAAINLWLFFYLAIHTQRITTLHQESKKYYSDVLLLPVWLCDQFWHGWLPIFSRGSRFATGGSICRRLHFGFCPVVLIGKITVIIRLKWSDIHCQESSKCTSVLSAYSWILSHSVQCENEIGWTAIIDDHYRGCGLKRVGQQVFNSRLLDLFMQKENVPNFGLFKSKLYVSVP